MLPSHIVTTPENYNNAEEGGFGADTHDSPHNEYDTGAFPSVFSCLTSFWCWLVLGLVLVLVLGVILFIILIVLSFKNESLSAKFLIDIISSMVTIFTPVIKLIGFIKVLFRKRRQVIEEENRGTQSSRPRSSSSLEL